MNINWDSILSQLSSTAVFTAISSLIIGGVATIFKRWVISEEQFKYILDFTHQRIISKLAKSQSHMLNKVLNSPDPFQDDPPTYITDHAEEILKFSRLYQELDTLYKRVTFSSGFMMSTIFIAIIGILISQLLIETRPYIALFFYILIMLQGIIITRIRKAKKTLEFYSKTI